MLTDMYSFMLMQVLRGVLLLIRLLKSLGLYRDAYALAEWCRKEADWASKNL